MAGNDVFLFSVPSDASIYDVRLRDPTTSGVAAGDITVTAAQTLADIVNAASVAVIISATAAQTLDAIVSVADVDVVVSLNASQTLADIVSAGSAAVTISITAGQTLDGIVNAASVAVVSATGDVDYFGNRYFAPNYYGPRYWGGAIGDAVIALTAAQTLDDIVSAASVFPVPVVAVVIPSLGGVMSGGGGAFVRVDSEGTIHLAANDADIELSSEPVHIGVIVSLPAGECMIEMSADTAKLGIDDLPEVLDIIGLLNKPARRNDDAEVFSLLRLFKRAA